MNWCLRWRAGHSGFIRTPAVCLAALAAVPALGSEADPVPRRVLEEVVVTARKMEESLQSVPVAASSIAGRELEAGYIADLSDVAGIAPNVVLDPTIGFSNAASISIRGVSFQDVEKSFDPAVGVVVDGVYLATNSQALLSNFDIARIEVLRGPQGTLFGKNTTGGVVNVVRNRPEAQTSGTARVTYGNRDHREIQAIVNLPLADGFAVRLAGNLDKSDGYVKNTTSGERLNGTDLLQGRLAALWTPVEQVEVYLNYDHIRDRGDTVGLRNATLPTQLFAVPMLGGLHPTYPGFAADEGPLHEVRSDVGDRADYTTDAVSLEVNWSLADLTLTSITGYREVEEAVDQDFDGEAVANFNSTRLQDHDQFTQELRLTGRPSARSHWVAGVYYYRSEYELHQQIDVLTDWLPCGVLPGPFAALGCSQAGVAGQVSESYAGFAQGSLGLGENWRLTVGLRYTYEEKDFFNVPITFPPGGLGRADAKEDWSELTPRVGFDYQLNDDVFLYLSYATGFKSGGFNGRAGSVTSIGPYSPETVDTIEAGIKSEWLERRLRLNLTAFHNDYQDMQVEVLRSAPGGTGQETVVMNAASATTYGLEAEMEVLLGAGLSVSANVGVLEAEYDAFTADLGLGGVTDNSDLELRRAPPVTLGLAASYQRTLGGGAVLGLLARYTWQDDLHTTTQNLDLGHRRDLGLLSAAVNYESPTGRWSIGAYGRNLTDESYVADGIALGNLVSLQTVSRPREVGVQFGVRL